MINKTNFANPIRRVAVVGSGLAGLTTAIRLAEREIEVTVFEKSRGPGGRLASKRVPGGSADVGAQYFTVRNPDFHKFLDQYAGEQSYSEWHGRLGYQTEEGRWQAFPEEPRYVGTPRMTAVSRSLSKHVDVTTETRIQSIEQNEDRLCRLFDTEGNEHGPYDAVVITAPPAQARDILLASTSSELALELDEPVRHVQPCWAVAAHFTKPPMEQFDGMRVSSDILSWVANNSSKPGREDEGQWWVLHATSAWSQQNEETDSEQVIQRMLSAFKAETGASGEPDEVVAHRWLYAKSSDNAAPGCLWFADERIGLAGDWLSGGRVEGAFNSAEALVKEMLADR